MTPMAPRRLIPRQRNRRSASAMIGAVLATGVLAVTAAGDSAPAAGQPARETTGTTEAAGPAGPAPPPSRTPPPGTAAAATLAGLLGPLDAAPEVRLAVTVFDPATGRSLSYGSGHFDTASVVKVDVVAALLLRAQDEGRSLTAREQELAAAAIRRSDNDATHELWELIGGAPGLDAANLRLGLTETAGGADGHWGLTQTTTADQITLLQTVFGTASPLNAESRRLLQRLMSTVAEGQRWGVSAAAEGEPAERAGDGGGRDHRAQGEPAGAERPADDAVRRRSEAPATALKNGWVPRSHTDLWNINSIGRVTVGGRPYLVAVLSAGHRTSEHGITVVEAAARSAVDVIRSAPVA